jgi:hydroxymethylbilane synthase
MRPFRIGTRGSRLAIAQSAVVAARLRALGVEAELVTIVTAGDVRAADTTAGEGAFVGAIERALAEGEVDLAVHSAKDVPLGDEDGLLVAAFPERADPRDVLVTPAGGASLASLPVGARIGTDSPRRSGFARAERPDLEPVPLHGNVDTRLRRLDHGDADALLLAAAGLDRLGFGARADERLAPTLLPPAPGQGALAVQARAADSRALDLLAAIDSADVRAAVTAERAALAAMGGGCRAPIGALATVSGRSLTLVVGAVEPDGRRRRIFQIQGHDPSQLGSEAGRLLAKAVEA